MDDGLGAVRGLWGLTDQVIGSCIDVHRQLGPGLLETAYRQCLCHELALRGLRFETERPLPVRYKGVRLECGYRLDLVVEGSLVVELKAVERLARIHEAQLITYLKLSGLEVGLLVNFHAPALRDGIRRLSRKRSPDLTGSRGAGEGGTPSHPAGGQQGPPSLPPRLPVKS